MAMIGNGMDDLPNLTRPVPTKCDDCGLRVYAGTGGHICRCDDCGLFKRKGEEHRCPVDRCDMAGHDWTFIMVAGKEDPVAIVCERCPRRLEIKTRAIKPDPPKKRKVRGR